MDRLIFTADDYGACDGIDLGVLDAVGAGRINSVACFANGPNAVHRIRVLNQARSGKQVDLGCHLTLTSGRPLTDAVDWMRHPKTGEFRSYIRHNRLRNEERREKEGIKTELAAQIKALTDFGAEVRHLSSHHNILCWWRPHWDAFTEIARDFNIPIRSPLMRPVQDNKAYLFSVRARAVFRLTPKHNKTIRLFHRGIEGAFGLLPEAFRHTCPDYADARAYGPPLRIAMRENDLDRIVRNKGDDLNAELENLAGRDESTEFIFHLLRDNTEFLHDFRRQIREGDTAYNGIDWGYFDRRIAEQRALMQLILPEGSSKTAWGKLPRDHKQNLPL